MDLIPDPPDPTPSSENNSTHLQQRLQIVSTIVTLCVALLAIGADSRQQPGRGNDQPHGQP